MPSPITIGGSHVSRLDYTRSWGVTPASATIICPGGGVDVAEDDDVVINIGGSTFYGVVTSVVEETTQGVMTRIQAADKRLFLHREYVCGSFNMVEIREDNLATLGIDRQRRFVHIYPANWNTQLKTYTDEAHSAWEIIEMLRDAPTVSASWVFTHHEALESVVHALDFNNGNKLANVLHEITDKLGLVFSLFGENVIEWARKGDGSVPTVPAEGFDLRDGSALSNNDTRVLIVGDRNRVQVNSVALEPDWSAHFEAYWLESAWIGRIDSMFGPFPDNDAGQADLFAKAKSITVRAYLNAVGDASIYDYGRYGEVSRMELPAWIYITDVVYKAYRVPGSFAIGESDWSSLLISEEGLNVEMDYSPSSGALGKKIGGRTYPEEKALIIAQGQATELIDPRYQKALTPAQLNAQRDLWRPVTRFNFDVKHKVVMFEEAIFRPGADPNGLLVFPNVGLDTTNLPGTHPSYNLAIPNAAVTISPAPVRASLCFEVNRYSREYGSGNRRGTHYTAGLRQDSYYVSGVFSEEVRYVDGDTAQDKADAIAAGLTLRQASYLSGGWKRRGGAGTALNGIIDRVTTRVQIGVGLEEEVEYTKERMPVEFINERQLDRNARLREVFPGQEKNRQEEWELRQISRVARELKRNVIAPLRSPNDVMSAPIGALHPSPQSVHAGGVTAAGGQPILTSKVTGKANLSGEIFAGISVAKAQTGRINIATQGVVPARVKGPVTPAQSVYAHATETYCSTESSGMLVGTVLADYPGTETVLLPVRIAGGSGSARVPLAIAGAGKDNDGVHQIRVFAGGIEGVYPDGMSFGDRPPYVLKVIETTGVVYAVITVDVGNSPDDSGAGDSGDTGDGGDAGSAGDGGTPGHLETGSLQWSSSLQSGSLQSGSLITHGLESGSLETHGLESGSLETHGLRSGSLQTHSIQAGSLQPSSGPDAGSL